MRPNVTSPRSRFDRCSEMRCKFAFHAKNLFLSNVPKFNYRQFRLDHLPFGMLGHVEIALASAPTLMLFGQQSPNQAHRRRLIGENPNHFTGFSCINVSSKV